MFWILLRVTSSVTKELSTVKKIEVGKITHLSDSFRQMILQNTKEIFRSGNVKTLYPFSHVYTGKCHSCQTIESNRLVQKCSSLNEKHLPIIVKINRNMLKD